MANTTRPFVHETETTTLYHSIDTEDEQLYNDLTWQYERNAFLDMINGALSEEMSLRSGASVRELWISRSKGLVEKWKQKSRKLKPAALAVAPQDVPPPSFVIEGDTNPARDFSLPSPDVVGENDNLNKCDSSRDKESKDGVSVQNKEVASKKNIDDTPEGTIHKPDKTAQKDLKSDGPVLEPDLGPVRLIISGPDEEDATLAQSDRVEPSKAIRQQVRSDLGGNWRFARVIAQKPAIEGRQPMYIDLYARVNENGFIEDRVVAKVEDFQRMPATETEEGRAEKEYNMRHGYEAIRNEVNINTLLARTRCSHIIGYRGNGQRWKRDIDDKYPAQTFIYSDYAEGGTLGDIIAEYAADDDNIPEHYIWFVWDSLLRALVVLRDGMICVESSDQHAVLNSGLDKSEDIFGERWQPIVHRDIKDVNVFIGASHSIYPFWRGPLLADFGLSRVLENYDPKGPGQIISNRGAGTPMWLAPEQACPDTNNGRKLVWPISERTDMWAIAYLMWHMVHANKGLDELREMRRTVNSLLACKEINGIQPDMPPMSIFSRDTKTPAVYSDALINLLVECLMLDAFGRPSLEDLVNQVQFRLKRLDKSAGLDRSSPPTELPADLILKSLKRNREFEIGERFPSAAKRRRTKQQAAQEQYDELNDEDAASSVVDDDARLIAIRDVFAVMHTQHSYDETLIRDYSLLQRLLYELTFDHINDSKLERKAIKRPLGKKATIVKVLRAYEKISRGKSRQVSHATREAQKMKAALDELNHAMRWGLELIEHGKWQVLHPEFSWKPVHEAVALYILSELRNDDGDTEFENLREEQ